MKTWKDRVYASRRRAIIGRPDLAYLGSEESRQSLNVYQVQKSVRHG